MNHAEICPVCLGKGVLTNQSDWVMSNNQLDAIKMPNTCRGCGGKGWITVEDGTSLSEINPKTYKKTDKV